MVLPVVQSSFQSMLEMRMPLWMNWDHNLWLSPPRRRLEDISYSMKKVYYTSNLRRYCRYPLPVYRMTHLSITGMQGCPIREHSRSTAEVPHQLEHLHCRCRTTGTVSPFYGSEYRNPLQLPDEKAYNKASTATKDKIGGKDLPVSGHVTVGYCSGSDR